MAKQGGEVSGQGDELPSVEAVGFSSALPVAVTGSLSGMVGVWDIPTQKLRQQLTHEVLYFLLIRPRVKDVHEPPLSFYLCVCVGGGGGGDVWLF